MWDTEQSNLPRLLLFGDLKSRFQNGMYERSHESGTEANYDMVDGLVNNQKKAVEKIQNPAAKRPKKRASVIKKLHEKQIAIAKRSGKPVPRYLEQQIAQERSRK